MPPVFTARLAERLHSLSKLPVAEAVSGAVVSPGKAWIAPGDRHMAVVRDGTVLRLLTHQDPPENSCRPAVDVLFRSAARTCGAGTLAVIMTGMGKDGLRGCEAVRVAGGRVLAQDEATSVVWGMPGVVAEAGLADQVLPLDRIGGEIVRCFRPGRAGAMHAMPMPVPAAMPGAVSGIPQAAAAAAGAAETAEAP
jgi:two-component system chemotaxis response regulator CheB